MTDFSKGKISLSVTLLCVLLCLTHGFAQDSPVEKSSSLRFEAGISAGSPTPAMLLVGLGYKSAIFRIEALGTHSGDNDYWIGVRGNLAWTLFYGKPFTLDLGIGGGYEYAEAPNRMHQALNRANGATYLYPFNYKESLDLSLGIWAKLYGFFTHVAYPVHYFKKHDEPTLIWRIGYLVEL